MFKLEPRSAPSKVLTFASPLIALAITVIVGVILFVALGKDPVAGLKVFFVEPLKSGYALSELSLKATPLVLIALGLSVCFRANLWNIGAEGQFILGAICAGGVAMQATPESGPLLMPAVLAAGALGGMAWAAIVALLRDRFNASEILVSLMLVYVAEMLLSYLVYGPWKDPNGYNFPQTITFLDAARVPKLVQGWRMNIGLFIAAVAVVGFAGFLYRTFAGFQLQGGRHGRAGWRARRGRAARAADALCAAGLRLCGHHRGLRGPAQSLRHRVLRGAHEHVLHRR